MRVDGQQLRRLREERGLNQKHVAIEAKIAVSYISMIEAGIRTDVSANVAGRIATALDVSVSDLRPRAPRIRPRRGDG